MPNPALPTLLAAIATAAAQRLDRVRSAAEGMRDLLHRQMNLQVQQSQFRMVLNILRVQNDTLRIKARNLGGNTQYVYRW